jgi:hypothetical protein
MIYNSLHSIDQKVLTLKEYGEDKFIEDLNWLELQSNRWDQKNYHWFHQLKISYKKYPEWFFLMDGDVPVAFSTVQKYYEGCYRVLTRLYIYRDYRIFANPKDPSLYTIGMRLLPYQLDYIKRFETVFVSMQAGRKNAIERTASKLSPVSTLAWKIEDEMIQTCNNPEDPDCWQHVAYTGKKLDLPRMLENDYKRIFNTPDKKISGSRYWPSKRQTTSLQKDR